MGYMSTLLTSVLTYVLTFVMEQFRISLIFRKKISSIKALKMTKYGLYLI